MADAKAITVQLKKRKAGSQPAFDRVERIGRAAKKHGAVLASHDDDTLERMEALAEQGVRASEFPINAGSARRAKELGLAFCMVARKVPAANPPAATSTRPLP